MKIITQWAVVAAVISASTAALADDVPLKGTYGSLAACLFGFEEAFKAASFDDGYAIVSPSGAAGMEWSCAFKAVRPSGDHEWKVSGDCGSEGEETTPALTIKEIPGRSVTIASPEFFGPALVLPACSLPYAEQVGHEVMRFLTPAEQP